MDTETSLLEGLIASIRKESKEVSRAIMVSQLVVCNGDFDGLVYFNIVWNGSWLVCGASKSVETDTITMKSGDLIIASGEITYTSHNTDWRFYGKIVHRTNINSPNSIKFITKKAKSLMFFLKPE